MTGSLTPTGRIGMNERALPLATSIPALLRDRCARYADRIAYVAFGTDLRFDRLLRDAETFAAWLQAEGVQPGDRVGILLPNCLAFPVVAFGTLLAGAVLAPLNPLSTRREIERSVARLRPARVVSSPLLAASLPADVVGPVVGASLGDGHGWKAWAIRRLAREPRPPAGWVSLARILRQPRTPIRVNGQPDDLAMLQATGGSTGAPKYARLTQGNLLTAVAQLLVWCGDRLPPSGSRVGMTTLAALPLYHSYGFVGCALQGVALGGRTVLIPDARRLGDVTAAWRRHAIDVFPGVDTLFRGLLADRAFLAALARRKGARAPLVTAGAMPLAKTTAERWKAAAGYSILQGYGSTETTSAISCTAPGLDYDGCVGPPLHGTAVRICGADGTVLAPGEVGELHVRGGQVSPGYWEGEEPDAHTEDGWFRTGDLALEEQDGRLRLMGRQKELVIVSGFNVYPAEIEAFFGQHSAVAECAALGVPDERTGEAVILFVVLRPGADLEHVETFAREGLTAYKRPRRFVVVDAMPKTPVGKILKSELARLAPMTASADTAKRRPRR